MKKLAIVTTHPIQYYAPVFALLHARKKVSVKVFYTLGESSNPINDRGFNQHVNWDIPLFDGYEFEWAINTSIVTGSHHFRGIVNPGLFRQISEWQPDAVLVYGWAYSGHLNAMRFFKNKIPVFFKGDSTLLNNGRGLKRLLKIFFLRWVYSHVDHAFFNGKNNWLYFKAFGLKDKQLSFAPHAIDNERFSADRADEAHQLRLSNGIPEEAILVLYAGKFDRVKNLSLLLSAFSRLENRNIHLILAGDGAEAATLKSAATVSSMSDRIHFIGFQNQTSMPVLYQSADLVCLPSLSETWGLAVNEAMACKKAVLVSDKVGCADDLVREGVNGDIFKSNDVEDLFAKLSSLTLSKEVLRNYGDASARMISEWNFTKVAEAIEDKISE